VPPVGRVSFPTHSTPLKLSATVESVDTDSVQRLIGDAHPVASVQSAAEDGLPRLVREAAIRAVLVALVAGLIVGASLAVALLLGVTWRDFSVAALARPTYDGAIERAPQVISALEKGVASYQTVQDRVNALSNRISQLASLGAASTVQDESDEVRLLHVSDIHLNPVGVDFAGDLARRFDVAAIVDTGDLTSFGYPAEANIGSMVSKLGVPYYFVPGNHDSCENRAAIARYPT